jgi:LemA protein
MAISESYPQLKADGLFQNLQAQLEGTENRVAVARNRYVAAVQDYNTFVRSFPQNLTAKMFGYQPKANFTVENERQISTAPTVDFSRPAPPATQPQPTSPQSMQLPPPQQPPPQQPVQQQPAPEPQPQPAG